jgi:Na+/H+-dicarboxylate symporter
LLVLVRWIIWLAPLGVFALMLPLGAHGGAGLAGAVGFYIAAYSIGASCSCCCCTGPRDRRPAADA